MSLLESESSLNAVISQLEVNERCRDNSIFTGEWIRKATEAEEEMESSHQQDFLLIWDQLDLCSAEPLQEEHVRESVTHLYRKVPSLNICYGNLGGDVWFRKATNTEIDFQVLRNKKLEEVRESLRHYSYKSETGPLFCVRLLFNSPDTASDTSDLDPSFPFRSHIFFGFHHGITDGTSNMNIMGFFISLLNDVISNRPINDNEPLGHFASDEETMKLVMEQKTVLEEDIKLRTKIEVDLQYIRSNTPIIVKSFPIPDKKENTASIVKVLDQSACSNFIRRCKQEKVTVNSVLTAIVNMVIAEVLFEYGPNKDSYVIANFHNVNLRRFWSQKVSVSLGLHTHVPLMLFSDTSKDVRSRFWDYAKTIGSDLKEYLSSGRIFADRAHSMFYPEEPRSSTDHMFCDFVTSNMGDVTSLVTEGGGCVRITNVVCGSAIHKTPAPLLINSHTYRDKFTIIFDYNEAILQSEIVEKLSSRVEKGLREMAL